MVELYLYSPYKPYGLYRTSVPVQGVPFTFFTSIDLTHYRLTYTAITQYRLIYTAITQHTLIYTDIRQNRILQAISDKDRKIWEQVLVQAILGKTSDIYEKR